MRILNPGDDRPPYVQVADAIRRDIRTGLYPPGAPLPSRRVAATEFGVAEMTVGNAWRILRDEGLIVSRQGSGVYVCQVPDEPRNPLVELDELREEVATLKRRLDALESDKA